MSVAEIPSAPPAQRIEELGRIILAYSEVTEKLQQSHDRLEQTVASLREELSEKNRMLERRNRLAALGEMAAGMAHEIRNPLGGIQLYASMLESDVADRPQSLGVVRKITLGVRRLEGLVSQVLQFTREIRASERSSRARNASSAPVSVPADRAATTVTAVSEASCSGEASWAACWLGALAGRNEVLSLCVTLDSDGSSAIAAAAPATQASTMA